MRNYVVGLGRWGAWLAVRLDFLGQLEGVASRQLRHDDLRLSELSVEHSDDVLLRRRDLDANDCIWLCISDDGLPEWLTGFAEAHEFSENEEPLIIIASGGTSLNPLSEKYPRVAAAWPVQSFVRDKVPDWSELGFLVQVVKREDADSLLEVCQQIGGLSPKLVKDDTTRQTAHLGAVVVQNFANLLWREADDLLREVGLNWQLLLPLARAHFAGLALQVPDSLQTGPAARGDVATQEAHQRLLSAFGKPELATLYRELSKRIAELEDE